MKWDSFPDIIMSLKKGASMDKLDRIRELHSPIDVPKGMRMIGSKTRTQLYCAGCDCGDPYLAVEWPCETRIICDEEETN